MTLGELKTAVDSFGNETKLEAIYDSIEIDENGIGRVAVDARFCSVVTRCLEEINAIRPRVKHTTLAFRRPKTVFAKAGTVSANGFEILLSGGAAYTFEVCGTGSYTLAGETHDFDLESFKQISGKVPAGVKSITLAGDFSANIRNAAVYSDNIGDNVPPYRARAEYEIAEDDFVTLDGKSLSHDDILRYGITIIDNRKISVPWETSGEIDVRYPRRIAEVTIETEDATPLDIDREFERLLPLLVASYVLLDDENSAKAQYYRQIYEADKAQIMRSVRNLDPNNIIKTNNW